MARTAVVPTVMVRNSAVLKPSGTTIDATLVTNGVVIAKCDFKRTVFEVANTAAGPKNIIIRGGDYPLASAGRQGDLTIPVTNATTKEFGPFDSGRFAQDPGGDLHIDFEAGTTGTILARKLPK
jgi:hypothetical protein